MNKNIVMIIPYFGKVPDYFNLWLKSAESNPNFTFYIYTDLDFNVNENSNVKIKHITFCKLVDKIKCLFGDDIKLKNPYKLCDYKPAYGLIFQDDIKEFDFWGFCDIDLIFGDLNKFISSSVYDEYDKIFYHGHFSLFKNCKKMYVILILHPILIILVILMKMVQLHMQINMMMSKCFLIGPFMMYLLFHISLLLFLVMLKNMLVGITESFLCLI